MRNGEVPVVVDAGWLGHTGVGRLTERFLRGASEAAPPGWILWGTEAVRPFAWPGSRVSANRHGPMAGLANRDVLSVPDGEVVLFLHAVRPLPPGRPCIVYLHDTIPLRWDGRARRLLWAAFYRASARTARTVVVNSRATADRAIVDLGVAATRIHLAPPSPDHDLIGRITAARHTATPSPILLYVGQAKPHKNLQRAIAAFQLSRFRRGGGRFAIVGGRHVVGGLDDVAGVEYHPEQSEADLVDWYARATAVILPSLEEGYGLPVIEALASGIPVACSDIEPLRTTAQGQADLFDPRSTASIAAAIDRVTDAPEPRVHDLVLLTDREFADSVTEVLG